MASGHLETSSLHRLREKLASLVGERHLPASVRAVLHEYSCEIADELQRRQKPTVGEESFAGLGGQESAHSGDALSLTAEELLPDDDTWPPVPVPPLRLVL